MSEKTNWTRRLAFASLVFALLALLAAGGLLTMVLLRNVGSPLALPLAADVALCAAGCWLIVLILKRGQS